MRRRGSWLRLEIVAVAVGVAVMGAVVMACSSFGTEASAADAGGNEAGAAESGASDGAVDAEDGALVTGGFCAGHPGALLCDDFDDPLRAVWKKPNVATGGSVVVVTNPEAPSPPSSLRTTAVKTSTTTCTISAQDATLDVPAPNGVHLEFKLRPEQLPGPVPIGPSVKLAGKSETCEYYLNVDPTGTVLVQEHTTAAETYKSLNRKLAIGAWTKVSMDLSGQPPGRTITVSLDDVMVLANVAVDPLCQEATRIVSTGVGLYCVNANSNGDVAVSFDDVLLTVP
jgi:hypothetical protein